MHNLRTSLPSLQRAFRKTQLHEELGGILDSASGGLRQTVNCKTLHGSLKAVVCADLIEQGITVAPHHTLIITGKEHLDQWHHDMSVLCGDESVAVCMTAEKKRRSVIENNADEIRSLVESVALMENNPNAIVIATPESFTLNIPNKRIIHERLMTLKRNQHAGFEDLQHTLLLNGFERQDYVSKAGEIAVRGGLIDVFPIGWSTPLRIEFWGDAIESIREFDSLSQRSIREHAEVQFLAVYFHEQGDDFSSSLLEYLTESTLLVIDAPDSRSGEFETLGRNDIDDTLRDMISFRINQIGEATLHVRSEPQPHFESSVEKFYHALGSALDKQTTCIVSAEGNIHTKRIKELVENAGERLEEDNVDHYHIETRRISWESSTLHEGFVLPDLRLAVFTEHQIFNRRRFRDARKGASTQSGITLRELQQLRKGDLIVHVDKGIGQFDGLETITIGGAKQESVRLIFQGGDVLYVHLNYITKLQRYSAQDGTPPKLSKLGSSEWERKKQRTKKKLKDIARDLITLYAERKKLRGYPFPGDSVWQKEFEASFMYEDTPDQARATGEVKNDMESLMPMDRLLCGDVGFGKTEVAIRAAFKAAQSGKQVAVLVPTTILAHQHYMTFSERLKRYPVKVDVISRFRTTDEQKVISERVGSGEIDILIGTHRMLSKDIRFKDIGLLVIDEEQRFGVGAKEKLRAMRTNVDTLTLTATPIPRTLNFSLMGARDLSIMETAPRNRLPVETSIIEWSDSLLRDALTEEMERGGQIYFVNDTIQDLDALAMRLVEIVPGLKFGIAHGQMESTKLETVMERFLERKFDVLLTTKIVESGLDIPNVNTIFINRADRFGLAELYQLRGRVGRSNTQAYCYLIVPPVRTLNKTSLRRLQAIEEHTDLGSGFKLAMRDLEIRGAGNLLGAEQSGFIAELGFETYQRILDEAVQELRTEEFSELFGEEMTIDFSNNDMTVETEGDSLLPETYIRKDTERFEFYKRLYKAATAKQINDIGSELRDRYGALPEQAENLLYVVRIRQTVLACGFERVTVRGGLIEIEIPASAREEYYERVFPHIAAAIAELPGSQFKQQGKKTLVLIPCTSQEDALAKLQRVASSQLPYSGGVEREETGLHDDPGMG
ncbi:MAG: transcription-repair coupling factor [Candidatus Kapabacteria bacterium]|nr:transcription-repair coupling factor [Candidatus Kapabacteria bacterium]